jgi:putative DNA primase/helicase
LLDLVKGENAGFNLHGPSSLGKTTLAYVAASAWGPGGRGGYAQSWRATDNGLEGLAEAHNDCLLVLDDLGECQPEAAGAAAYMLGNGRGKVRAQIDGLPRPVKEWRIIYLSTAEIALGTKMAEGRGPALKAGQAVRLIEIAADTGSGYGVFDAPHGFENEKDCKVAGQRFSNHLVEVSRQYYGTAAPDFIRRVIRHRKLLAEEYPSFQASFCATVVPSGADGQVRRVAEKFALVAYAGKLACEFNIVPIDAKEMTSHISQTFKLWLRERETAGSLEHTIAVRQIVHFLQTQGDHRFSVPTTDHKNVELIEPATKSYRAGYIEKHGENCRWLVFPGVYTGEMLRGQNPRAVNQYLIDMGALIPASDGKASQSLRINGKQQRFYVLTPKIMELAV